MLTLCISSERLPLRTGVKPVVRVQCVCAFVLCEKSDRGTFPPRGPAGTRGEDGAVRVHQRPGLCGGYKQGVGAAEHLHPSAAETARSSGQNQTPPRRMRARLCWRSGGRDTSHASPPAPVDSANPVTERPNRVGLTLPRHFPTSAKSVGDPYFTLPVFPPLVSISTAALSGLLGDVGLALGSSGVAHAARVGW